MDKKYCASLELAKRLKELGFPQETDFEYRQFDSGKEMFWSKPLPVGEIPRKLGIADVGFGIVAAPHVGELGEWLPLGITLGKTKKGFSCYTGAFNQYKKITDWDKKINLSFIEEHIVISCAKMLIYLAENNLLDPKTL